MTSLAHPLRAWRRAHDAPTRLSAADEAWLRMDRARNPMVICAVMLLGRTLEARALREIVVDRLLPAPRFRLPLSRRPAPAPDRDAMLPVHVEHLAAGAGDADLWARIGELMLRPLPASAPMWEVHLLTPYRGGCVLIWRVHHAVGDGTALLRVLLGAADGAPSDHAASLPMHRGPRLRDAFASVASLARLVFLPRDARTPLKVPLSGVRKVAWSVPIPIDAVKAVSRREHATVNDVLTSALAGAVHRQLGPDAPRSVRALVPFDLRAGRTDARLGNRFGLLFLPLPVGASSPRVRLAQVKRRTARLKNSPEPFVVFALLQLIGLVSPWLAALAIRFFARKATLVLTNVAGPRAPLSLGGAPIDDIVFWVPQAERIGLGLSIFSYRGQVRVGVNADAACVPDPRALADAFADEFEKLRMTEPVERGM